MLRQVSSSTGVLSLTTECSRTGMPHPFDISLIDKGRSGTHQIEVSPDTVQQQQQRGRGRCLIVRR